MARWWLGSSRMARRLGSSRLGSPSLGRWLGLAPRCVGPRDLLRRMAYYGYGYYPRHRYYYNSYYYGGPTITAATAIAAGIIAAGVIGTGGHRGWHRGWGHRGGAAHRGWVTAAAGGMAVVTALNTTRQQTSTQVDHFKRPARILPPGPFLLCAVPGPCGVANTATLLHGPPRLSRDKAIDESSKKPAGQSFRSA